MLIDNGSSVNILFKKAFDQMKLETSDLKPCEGWTRGFNSSVTSPLGYLDLSVTLGKRDRRRVKILPFVVMDLKSYYKAFL